MVMQDNLRKLYDAVSTNLDVGGYDAFASKMQTPDQRKAFYDAVSKEGLDLGDYAQYESRLKKKDDSSVSSEDSSLAISPFASPTGIDVAGLPKQEEDAAWADLPEEQQHIIFRAEQHYKKKGWPSPYEKIQSFKDKEADLVDKHKAGKISDEEYISSVKDVAKELGVSLSDEKISVSQREMKMYSDVVDRYFREDLQKRLEKDDVMNREGYVKDFIDGLGIGSHNVVGLPLYLLGVGEVVSNKVINLIDKQDRGDATYWTDRAIAEEEIHNKMVAANQRYNETIGEAIKGGRMGEALGQVGLLVAETLPMVAMQGAISGAAAAKVATAGAVPKMTKAGAIYMAGDKTIRKYLQNEKDPNMSELTKTINAFGVGMSEFVFEFLGTEYILNASRRALQSGGKEYVRDAVLKEITPIFQRSLSALDKGTSAAIRESASEGATQLYDNLMDKASGLDVDLKQGVLESLLVGAVIGNGMALPQMVQEYGGNNVYTRRIANAVSRPDINFDEKMELIDLLIRGDEIDYQLKNGPGAMKEVLTEELNLIQGRVTELAGGTLKEKVSKVLGKEVSESVQEGETKPSDGKLPPEGEKPSEPSKKPSEGMIATRDAGDFMVKVTDRSDEEAGSFRVEVIGTTGRVAHVDVGKEGDRYYVKQAKTDPALEGKGIMTALYNKIESDLGQKLEIVEPWSELTDEGRAFRESTDRETEDHEYTPMVRESRPTQRKGPPEPPIEDTDAEVVSDELPESPLGKVIQRKKIRDQEMEAGKKTKLQQFKKWLDEQITDISKIAKDKLMKIGEKAPEQARRLINRINTQAGATGQSKLELQRTGRRVFGRGIRTMSVKEQDLLGDIISLTRTVELGDMRGKVKGEEQEVVLQDIKHEGGVTAEDAEAVLDYIWAKDQAVLDAFGLDDYNVDALKQAQEEYYNVMQEQLKKLKDNDLIHENLYDDLRRNQPWYSPRLYLHYLNQQDPEGSISGIKPLAGGSTGAALVDPYTLMAHTIQRTNALIHRNRLVGEMAKFSEAVPNEYVRKAAPSKAFLAKMDAKKKEQEKAKKEGKEDTTPFIPETFQPTPDGMADVDYMDNGIRKRLWVDKDIWDYIDYERDSDRMALAMNTASWLTGTPLLKLAATGMNPEFAIKNIPIDALHVWMTTDIYSSFMPLGMAQLLKDYAYVAKDAVTRKGRYLEYAEEGGLMDFLANQGQIPLRFGRKTKVNSVTKNIGEALRYIGETSEIWTRLALRDRYINNVKKRLGDISAEEMVEIKRDATAAARDYLDFSQGGTTAKLVDKFLPYFNAGVQVTRGSIRAAYNNPKLFALKMIQIGTLAYGLARWNLGHGGEDEDKKRARRNAYLNDISPGVKARNFIIMTNIGYTDTYGNKRYKYFKIPKDALQSSITSLIEDIYVKMTHDENIKLMDDKMFKALQHEFRNVSDLGNMPPALRALIGTKSNYDEFYERELWTGLDLPKGWGKGHREEEYYPGLTPERFVKWGEMTGRSPIRTQYIAKQFFTEGNMFASELGELLDRIAILFDDDIENPDAKEAAQKLNDVWFLRRVMKTTYPQAMGDWEEMQQEYNVMKQRHNNALSKFFQEEESAEEVLNDDAFNEFINNIAEDDGGAYEAERLMDRAVMRWLGDGVSSQVIKIKYLSPEVRARAFHELVKNDPANEDRYREEVSRLKLDSKRFMEEVGRLEDKETNEE